MAINEIHRCYCHKMGLTKGGIFIVKRHIWPLWASHQNQQSVTRQTLLLSILKIILISLAFLFVLLLFGWFGPMTSRMNCDSLCQSESV